MMHIHLVHRSHLHTTGREGRRILQKKVISRLTSTSSKIPTPIKPPAPSTPPSNVPLKSFAVGTIAGLAGSLVGLGGGFIMIPLMTSASFLSLSQHIAHGTSLFAVTTTGLAGGLSYGQGGNVDLYSAGAIAVTGMMTARLGAKFSNRLSQKQLKRVLGGFMVLVAPIVPLKPYLMSYKEDKIKDDERESKLKIIAVSSCIGLFSGFMAGLLGVGGGAVVVPALTLFTPMDHYTALGTSLTAMGLPAAVGTWTHYQAGNVNLRMAPFLAVGSLVGAYCGGRLAVKVDEDFLRTGFSGMMLTLGIRTFIKA